MGSSRWRTPMMTVFRRDPESFCADHFEQAGSVPDRIKGVVSANFDFGVPALGTARRGVRDSGFWRLAWATGHSSSICGELGILPYGCMVRRRCSPSGNRGFGRLPQKSEVGRYHSFMRSRNAPSLSRVTRNDSGSRRKHRHHGVRHANCPLKRFQFHPESILSAQGATGLTLMRNALRLALPRS